jgi:hypothetical protein
VNTTWVREWLLLETSPSNTGACLNCVLFDLDNMSLDSSQINIDASQQMTSLSTSRGLQSQGAYSNKMSNNLSSFFNSFKIYPKALEVDLQIKRKYLKKYCTTLSHFLNDQGITSGFIEFPNDIIEDNGYQLVKFLEFFGEGLNLHSVKKDNLFDSNVESVSEIKNLNYKSKSKQNSFKIIPDMKSINKKPSNKDFAFTYDKDQNSQRVIKLHKWLKNLLEHLKKTGMHLNSIRPEYLLSYQDLVIFWKLTDSKKVFVKKYKLSPQQYSILNKYSWCTLFFQIIKGRSENTLLISSLLLDSCFQTQKIIFRNWKFHFSSV